MGLWLVRQLCHRVEMARTEAGFTVRLATPIPEPEVTRAERGARVRGQVETAKARAAKARARATEMLRRYDELEPMPRRWSVGEAPRQASHHTHPPAGRAGAG
jgi:hypothetical protein